MGFLKRNLKIKSSAVKSHAYKAFVRPKLEYASAVWDPHTRVGVNSAPELDFLANSKSNSGIELELALLSPGGIGIELELPSFELELESELLSSELNSELPSWN